MVKKKEIKQQEKLQESDDEEPSTSSEDEPVWTQEHEAAFLKTLGALKGNKEDIYKDNVKFWDNSTLDVAAPKKNDKGSKAKPMFLKDYERKVILENEGKFEESDDEVETNHKEEPGYYELQEQIRKQIKDTIAEVSEDDDDLLIKRKKTTAEKDTEEEDYYEWLKTQNVDSSSGNNELNTLKKAWNDPGLNDEEKFLRDYLLNKDYETDAIKESIPTYGEIVDLEKDEEELDKQQDYETKYNFRFENPDQDFIKHYPRTVAESLRGVNNKRKEKRKEYKTRKAEEKEARKKEIAQKKISTKKHIEAKLQALRSVAGDDVPISIEDLEDDFDPKQYDERMKELFDKKYYEDGQEYPEDEEMEKPVFSDMEEEEDDASEPEHDNDEDGSIEREDEVEQEPQPKKAKQNVEEEGEGPRRKESRRKLKRAAAKTKTQKPLFDPNEKTFTEYLDEYYSLNYEDIIGDQPTKFKYRQVVPNSYGLDVGEILNSEDQQLNTWVSLKKVTAYKSETDEKAEVRNYQLRAVNTQKKEKIFNANMEKAHLNDVEDSPEAANAQEGGSKKKNKRRKKKAAPVPNVEIVVDEVAPSQKTPRRRKKKPTNGVTAMEESSANGEKTTNASTGEGETAKPKQISKEKWKLVKNKNKVILPVDNQRLAAFGINPKKFANKLKYGAKTKQD